MSYRNDMMVSAMVMVTKTADQADLAKLGSAQWNLMSIHLTLVWQLPIIKHKIGRHGGCSWK